MKILLLVLGLMLFIIGFQDGIRILVDNQQTSIFSWLPGGPSLYIGLDVVLISSGALLAKYASQMKQKDTRNT